MADLTPGAAIQSFGGTAIGSAQHIASVGYPSVAKNEVKAFVSTLGSVNPVNLFNGTKRPRVAVFTCDVLIRASDATTDPAAANAEVVAGLRAIESLPNSGVLVVNSSTGGSSVSCAAERDSIDITMAPKNARHYQLTLRFTLLTEWA